MADQQQYLHDVLIALAQCAYRGGITHTAKGRAETTAAAGLGGRSVEDEDAAAVSAAIAAAETAAAAAATAEAAAVAARGRSRRRRNLSSDASYATENHIALDTDILMAFVVLHLLQVGFRPDIGTGSMSKEPSMTTLTPPTVFPSRLRRVHTDHHKAPDGIQRDSEDHPKAQIRKDHHARHRAYQQVSDFADSDGEAILTKPSVSEDKGTAREIGHEDSNTDTTIMRANLFKARMRQRRPDVDHEKLHVRVKSLRQPKGFQTYTRHLQLEQQRIRRLKALRLQLTQNQKLHSALTVPNTKDSTPRKHVLGQKLIRGNMASIMNKVGHVADNDKNGTKADKSAERSESRKSLEKKKLAPPTAPEIALNGLKSFFASPMFRQCAKMVGLCGWHSIELGSYSMNLRLPPLAKYRFSLIGLSAVWNDVLVVNLVLLPERSSSEEKDRPRATKYTQSYGPVARAAYTVAMTLSDFVTHTSDGPRLRLNSLPRLISLLRSSISLPASCAAKTSSNILNPSFLGLPTSSALRILTNLNARDVIQVSKTCKALHALSKDQSLWKRFIIRDFGPTRESQEDIAVEDWKNEYIRFYQVRKALKAKLARPDSNSSELRRDSATATHKNCGVNVGSPEFNKNSRKFVRGEPSKPIVLTTASDSRVAKSTRSSVRPKTHDKPQTTQKLVTKSHVTFQ